MGLFFNSDLQIKKDQILRDVAIVNNAIRNIATTFDNNGMNVTTINSMGSILENIESNITRINTTVRSMSDSQLSGFNAPWMDGSYYGIQMWLIYCATWGTQISNEIESYAKNKYGKNI
jgi:hypothetical protein